MYKSVKDDKRLKQDKEYRIRKIIYFCRKLKSCILSIGHVKRRRNPYRNVVLVPCYMAA